MASIAEDNNGGWVENGYGGNETTPLLRQSCKLKQDNKDGAASAFATFGVVWTITAMQAFIRWVASPTEFRPAPLLGPDEMATWRLVCLRIFEALSVAVLLAHIWFCILVPLFPRRGEGPRKLGLDGRFVIGGMLAVFSDGFLNCYQYIFMWNAHNVNMGVWAKFLPFHNHNASSRYAESLMWGPPMYVYFCAGFGIAGCQIAMPIQKYFPRMTKAGILSLVWVAAFAFDFVVENVAIRLTHGYGYSKTYGPLTLWPGQTHQFPIYEAIFVANLGTLFTSMRLQALESGISPVERGYWTWHPKLHSTIRLFACIGFDAAAALMLYHLPLNWLGIIGDCHADIPSYLRAG